MNTEIDSRIFIVDRSEQDDKCLGCVALPTVLSWRDSNRFSASVTSV